MNYESFAPLVRKMFIFSAQVPYSSLRKDIQDELLKFAHTAVVARGQIVEDRFNNAWVDPENFPTWFATVRMATLQEDRYGKTDAVIETSGSEVLKIQIKSGIIKKQTFKRWCEKGIIMLSLHVDQSLEQIRTATLFSIYRYWRRQERITLKKSSI